MLPVDSPLYNWQSFSHTWKEYVPFCNIHIAMHFRYPVLSGSSIAHHRRMNYQLKLYIINPPPIPSVFHDTRPIPLKPTIASGSCKWPLINSPCETRRRRVAAICPFNGNCDVPSTRLEYSCPYWHTRPSHVFPTSRRVHHTHAPIAHQGSVMVRLQFHLLLRHMFPSLFRFSRGLLSVRFIPVRLIRSLHTLQRILQIHISSFSSLSSSLSRFINSYMICITERYTSWDYVSLSILFLIMLMMTGKLELEYYILHYYVDLYANYIHSVSINEWLRDINCSSYSKIFY